ncbi:hypothetical protein O7627_30450 [Solwaraspora sp. WMMD1047]|uniref:hypothetical protein n=1 Tax=Solwaraspora sp. WMMD1047 TaxID=3016102 RepID=UPI0024165BE2|nr:hypothetical protein [Solwaraspora sp. WMMD1047]MDG4833597.1 hypothetical protein [Solwaraspora sp. WMMD1047]
MADAYTVICGWCAGLTWRQRTCDCRDGQLAAVTGRPGTAKPLRDLRGPWVGCRDCRGTGIITVPCHDCERRGRRRAQVVLTVGNLDTGQVASANLVPGSLDLAPTPDGRWWLPLRPIVADLAGRAGVAPASLYDPDFPERPGGLDRDGITLPPDWRPDLPEARRHELEGAALAEQASLRWLVLLGHTTAPGPADHLKLLGRLCALADQLRVDLVVEARRDPVRAEPSWDIRYELPGSPVPELPRRRLRDLLTAVATVNPVRAAAALAHADPAAPAHYFASDDPANLPRSVGVNGYPAAHDLDQLERRILRDAHDSVGGQAIWRDRTWWHVTLRSAPDVASAPHRPVPLVRGWEPPAPAYQGDPIPSSDCPHCPPPEPGAGRPHCPYCGGTRIVRHGSTLTVTDLHARCVHVNLRPDDGAGAAVAASYGTGAPVLRLPAHLRLGAHASTFAVRPEDLTSVDGELVLDWFLREGIVHHTDPDADPVALYLARATAGVPGARLFVRANDWAGPSLDDLARLVLGLGLALDVTAVDHRLNAGNPHLVQGVSWSVRVVHPSAPLTADEFPVHNGLPEAVAHCLRYLGGALRSTLPTDPTHPIPVPGAPPPTSAPTPPDAHTPADAATPNAAALTIRLRTLAATHPGRPVASRLDPTGSRLTTPLDSTDLGKKRPS